VIGRRDWQKAKKRHISSVPSAALLGGSNLPSKQAESLVAMKPRQMLLIVAVAVVVAAAAIFYFLSRAETQLPQTAASAVGPAETSAASSDLMKPGPLGDMTLGDPKAPNVVIEYASLTCPHCRAFNADVFKPFKAKYIDTGKVYYIFREFARDPVDTSAFMLARCAPRDRYFAIVNLLFEKQNEWAFVNDPKTALINLMKQVGFTQQSFEDCLKDQKIYDGVNAVRDGAGKFGVEATPTFFFNGKRRDGEQTLEDIDKILAG
jgi:protein-disulfide isomerase